MDNYIVLLNKDLSQITEGTKVCVTGIITDKWDNRNRAGIQIEDLTGSSIVSLTGTKVSYDKSSLRKGKRIRAWGKKAINRQGKHYICDIEKFELLDEISLCSSDLDMIEQDSRISLSKICKIIRKKLDDSQFIEITSRLLSRRIGDEILEPLMVEYPGFGSSIYLSPSPSSQLSEFLTVTMLPRAYTATSSFSSSYRFPNGSSEMPIIMAKAINLSDEDELTIILPIVEEIVESLSDRSIELELSSQKWDEVGDNYSSDGKFSFVKCSTEIPTIGSLWNSVVYEIEHLLDDTGNVLIECMHEKVNERVGVCTITFYPSQFLNWTSKAPKRQIQNLWNIYDGGKLYV